MDEPDKVYQLKDKAGSVRLYVDDEEIAMPKEIPTWN